MDNDEIREQLLKQPLNENFRLCGLCDKQLQYSSAYNISKGCDHFFCYPCLERRLVWCLEAEEDMKCPIDGCPFLLESECLFLQLLPKQIYDKFIIWRNSERYQRPSLRQSFQMSNKVNTISIAIDTSDLVSIQPPNQHRILREEPLQLPPDPNQYPPKSSFSCLRAIFSLILSLLMILPLILLLTFYAIIYAWMTISLCGSVASIIAIIYCLLEGYYILSIFIFLVLFFCVALLRFFIIHIGSINQNIIKKSARKWWEVLCALWKH